MTFEEIVAGVQQFTRDEVLKSFREDSCIASTRVVIRVLRHFDILALPFPCALLVYNAQFKRAVLAGDLPPTDGTMFAKWCDTREAWSVGVGLKPNEEHKGYVGHLVAVLPKQKVLIDASADQANRPHKGIVLPKAVVLSVTEGFLKGGEREECSVNGCALIYQPELAKRDYLKSPDWIEKYRTRDVIKAVIRRIEGK
jgi:hypothetical protein